MRMEVEMGKFKEIDSTTYDSDNNFTLSQPSFFGLIDLFSSCIPNALDSPMSKVIAKSSNSESKFLHNSKEPLRDL